MVRDDEWAKYVEVVEKKENAKKGQLELDTIINIYYSTSTNLYNMIMSAERKTIL